MQRLIDANKLPVRPINVGTVMFPEMRYVVYLKDIQNAPIIDTEPVVRCKDCIYWQDRKVRMENGEYRDYLPDEDMFVSIDKGINVGSHCTLHGYENMPGPWFWAKANDFCSNGKRKKCAKMDEVQK